MKKILVEILSRSTKITQIKIIKIKAKYFY